MNPSDDTVCYILRFGVCRFLNAFDLLSLLLLQQRGPPDPSLTAFWWPGLMGMQVPFAGSPNKHCCSVLAAGSTTIISL